MNKSIVARNVKGDIVEFISCWINMEDLIEVISIPNNFIRLDCSDNQLSSLPQNLPKNLIYLSCERNNIKQIPNLREFKKLEIVWCDICCFESYMLEMENIDFCFYC